MQYNSITCARPPQFPDVRANIRGEESDTFTNAAGETARVCVGDDAATTAESLVRVLGGDAVAAELLAQQVHGPLAGGDDGGDCGGGDGLDGCAGQMPDMPMDGFNFANMGIWVDPIGERRDDNAVSCEQMFRGV